VPPSPRPPIAVPSHLAQWQLPPGWAWGSDFVREDHRHFQEVVDALGRSLSLVSAPNPAHYGWLLAEARQLAHRNHPAIPTTYHYWAVHRDSRRGPGYLRRWIVGETLAARVRRQGPEDVQSVLRLLRQAGAVTAYLHDAGTAHGALSARTVWLTPSGRMWLLGWQWAVPRDLVPRGLAPDPELVTPAPEWERGRWEPNAASDQWQIGALAFLALTGELPPTQDPPPITLLRPDCPADAAAVIDRALQPDPKRRHASVSAMVRALDRNAAPRAIVFGSERSENAPDDSMEARLRWATGDDYETLAPLGSGTFGAVWRVRDLALAREVALKMLHLHIARDGDAVARFRREAQLAAQLAHPAIVPIYDFDTRGSVSWYTMELAEGGSVAELVRRSGPRSFSEIAPQVENVLDGLAAAHAIGVIHRDLKPENVLIDRYRRWRLSDFGIASALGEDVAGSSGTPAFAPPEQLLGEPQGPAADCFALAAIVYFVLTAHPPFGDVEGPAVLARQLEGRVDLDGFDPRVAEWLRRGLAADADARFSDASDMLQAWRTVRDALSRGPQRRGLLRRIFA
jgi:serine/threonine protein kinase